MLDSGETAFVPEKLSYTRANMKPDYTGEGLSFAYLRKDGGYSPDNNVKTSLQTNYIDVSKYDKVDVTTVRAAQTGLWATYDENYVKVRAWVNKNAGSDKEVLSDTIELAANEKYLVVNCYPDNATNWAQVAITGYYETKVYLADHVKNLQNKITELEARATGGNILWGKKYVACGDSFTEGDFSGFVDANGLSGRNSPEIYDVELAMYKTYPWWIGKRNNMTVINEAKCGSTLMYTPAYFDPKEGEEAAAKSYRNPFVMDRITKIPEDADYITLMFGLNEGSHSAYMGEVTDGGLDADGNIVEERCYTLYGAYNSACEWLLVHRPWAKIGIIIPGSYYSKAMREMQINVARR